MVTDSKDRWGILFIPKPGVKHTHKRWEQIVSYLDEKGVPYDVLQSESLKSVAVYRLTKMLIENGYRTIIVVGGDSALNATVNGIMAYPELVDEIKLGVIPNGFGNNFAHFWGFSEDDYKSAIGHLIRGRIRKVDVGICEYVKDDNPHKRFFINAVNVGLSASIIGMTEEAQRFVGFRFLAHIVTSFLMIFERKFYKLDACINYEKVNESVMSVCIGSASGYGQTPNAVPYNGMVDVSIITQPTKIKELAHGLWLLLAGKFLSCKKIHPYRTREVEISSAEHARISVDGRMINGSAPLKVKVMQEKLNFIIPSRP